MEAMEKDDNDIKTEVLVVGTGFAGLTAAIEAREQGKKVILIEKMKNAGGNSIISDGGIAAPGTQLQKTFNIQDNEGLMYKDMLKAGGGINHPELLSTVVSNAKEAFEWTIKYLKVPYMNRVDVFGGHSVPRCYTPEGKTGATIIKKMLTKVKALEIPIHYSVALESILIDGQGSVIGANVFKDYDYKTNQGIKTTVKTSRGIILAAGGYGADVKFRSIQDPRLNGDIQTTNKPFATAEVLKSALAIGASSVQLSHIQLGAWASPDEKGFGSGPLFADYILFQYGIIIDPKTGKRFVNELGDRKQTAEAILNVGYPCMGIADHKAVETSGWDIKKAIDKGVVKRFSTLLDVASFYDIDEPTLKETVERYNGFVMSKQDTDFEKLIVAEANPIHHPPFYCMRLWPKVHYTMGGLLVNCKGQVMDYNKAIIKGLYAAGEIVGGVHGASRLGSCGITDCIVFGRVSGKNI